jgi:DNA-binding SARP family transcriptional activator
MLNIRLFGTGEAVYLGRQLHGFPNHKACMLLCYLLINQKYPQDREKLAALWDLRQTLQSAGAAPDRYLFTSEDHIAFQNSSDYWLDIEVFEAAINSGQLLSSAKISNEYASQLERAINLYTGDLLENIYEDWCLLDRERLRSLYLKSISQLLRFHSIRGNYTRGLQYGDRLLAEEPTSELAHRQVICLYWLAGDRTSALAQYHRCRQILREQLGVSPMDETRQLYEQMRSGHTDRVDPFMRSVLELSPQMVKFKKQSQLSENLLDRLHELQRNIDESRTELRKLEQLILQSFSIPR